MKRFEKKFASYFNNQTSFLIERRIKREGSNFDLNLFSKNEKELIGLNSNFRNSLFLIAENNIILPLYSF